MFDSGFIFYQVGEIFWAGNGWAFFRNKANESAKSARSSTKYSALLITNIPRLPRDMATLPGSLWRASRYLYTDRMVRQWQEWQCYSLCPTKECTERTSRPPIFTISFERPPWYRVPIFFAYFLPGACYLQSNTNILLLLLFDWLSGLHSSRGL